MGVIIITMLHVLLIIGLLIVQSKICKKNPRWMRLIVPIGYAGVIVLEIVRVYIVAYRFTHGVQRYVITYSILLIIGEILFQMISYRKKISIET